MFNSHILRYVWRWIWTIRCYGVGPPTHEDLPISTSSVVKPLTLSESVWKWFSPQNIRDFFFVGTNFWKGVFVFACVAHGDANHLCFGAERHGLEKSLRKPQPNSPLASWAISSSGQPTPNVIHIKQRAYVGRELMDRLPKWLTRQPWHSQWRLFHRGFARRPR